MVFRADTKKATGVNQWPLKKLGFTLKRLAYFFSKRPLPALPYGQRNRASNHGVEFGINHGCMLVVLTDIVNLKTGRNI